MLTEQGEAGKFFIPLPQIKEVGITEDMVCNPVLDDEITLVEVDIKTRLDNKPQLKKVSL